MAELFNLKICSFNASGLRVKLKLNALLYYFKSNKYDIILLQEAHLVAEDIEYIKRIWKGEFHLSGNYRNSKGLITFFAKTINKETINMIKSDERYIISCINKKDGIKQVIVNIYAPNDDNEKIIFYDKVSLIIRQVMLEKPDFSLICAGDFNTVHDNELDIISGGEHNIDVVNRFKQLINENVTIDSWRLLHPGEKMYTWRRGDISRRLDYILVGEDIVQYLQKATIDSIGFSDHLLTSIVLKFNKFKFGKSYYKMNVSVLQDIQYINMMKNKIPEIIQDNSVLDPHLKWEMTKKEIKEITISYCKNLAVKKREEKLNLTAELEELKIQIANNPKNDYLISKQAHLRMKWEEFLIEETRGKQIRGGVKWIEEGEKCSKFFLALEKSRAANNTIFELKNTEGLLLTDEIAILNEIKEYYRILYKANETDEDNQNDLFGVFIQDLVVPTISEEERYEINQVLTIDEISNAIKKMNNGSAPGCDGLPIEFYKVFYNEIKYVLYQNYIYSFEQNILPYSQQQGILSLLHKGKELDRTALENWRPLSLTNSDYKILAKILALRIQKILNKIIHEDQCGFMKGRDISDILRGIDDLIESGKGLNNEHILLAIDFRKAFDTVSNEYILQCVDLFGLGTYMKSWINIIINNRTFSVKNGGYISSELPMERGVRQGCPLSPLLFIIALEVFALNVRQSESIRGIAIKLKNICLYQKIKLYADDTTFLLNGLIDFREILSKIKEFSEVSGLYINVTKTVAMKIGTGGEQINDFEGIVFVNRIKLLGIYFSNYEPANKMSINWEGRIERLERNLTLWTRRYLTLLGKVLILKTFGISQFIYVMKSIGLPISVLQKVNRMLFSFIWSKDFKSGKTFEKIKRRTICNDLELGGLNMIDIIEMQNTFNIQWALKLITQRHKTWAAIPRDMLRHVGGEKVFYSSVSINDFKGLADISSEFWKGVLKSWLEVNGAEHLLQAHKIVSLEAPLFNNKDIKYQNKSLYLPEVVNRGIVCVKDMTENNKLISYDQYLYRIGSYYRAALDYHILSNAIKKEFYEPTLITQLDYMNCAKQLLMQSNKSLRKLVNRKDTEDQVVGLLFWERKFHENVLERYAMTLKSTKEIKLREINFKILHNILTTNILLEKMKIKNSNKCDFCGSVDTIDHALVQCERLESFWDFILQWINREFEITIPDTDLVKLFGLVRGDVDGWEKATIDRINHTLLIAKHAIIKSKSSMYIPIEVVFEREAKTRSQYLKIDSGVK